MNERPQPAASQGHLERGHLSMRDQLVMAVTSVAPAYSIGLAMAALVASVAVLSPIAVMIGFLPNFGMAVAYYMLNRDNPNCGTSYTWVGSVFGRSAGFVVAWMAVVQSVIALAFATPFAGQITIEFLNRIHLDLGLDTGDLTTTTIVGAAWMLFVTLIVVRGIRVAAHLQYFLLGVEFLVVILLSLVGIFKGGGEAFSISWFDPTAFKSLSSFAAGMVIAVFLYAGWNTPVSLNEESEDQHDAPGRAPLIGLVILLFTFVLASVSLQMTIGAKAVEMSGTEALYAWSDKVFGSGFSTIAVFALFTSTLAVLQTTLLPTARFVFSMSRDGVIAQWWSRVHPRYGTPWAASLALATVVIAIAIFDLVLDQLNEIVLAGVTVSGIVLSIFYAITGFACARRFWDQARESARVAFWAVIVPLLSSLMLLGLAGYLLQSYWTSTDSFEFSGSNGRFQVLFAAVIVLSGVAVAAFLRARRWGGLESPRVPLGSGPIEEPRDPAVIGKP
jgi:amino acid transporter